MTENTSNTTEESNENTATTTESVTPQLVTDGGKDDAKVVGHNTDGSEDDVGVWGEVDGDGHGLATPDDVRVGGGIDADEEWVVEVVDDEDPEDSGNVVQGHSVNEVETDVVGATIGGGGREGEKNVTSGDYCTVGGGLSNEARGQSTSIGGPRGYATVSGGRFNTASALDSTVGGGRGNDASGNKSTVAGGWVNNASGNYSTVAGGRLNEASGLWATIAGGRLNEASGKESAIGGGERNEATATFATIAGGGWTDSTNREETRNVVYDDYGTISGGGNNQVGDDDEEYDGEFATVGGGQNNTASGYGATIGGGRMNEASTQAYPTVGGGSSNTASGSRATVAGGGGNRAEGGWSTVGGGSGNEASGSESTVAGGEDNEASGDHAMVPGGSGNEATGAHSFAAGRNANTKFEIPLTGDVVDVAGAFVWGDSSEDPVSPDESNQFVVQAGGGAKIYSESDKSAGVELPEGEGSWQSLSASAAKSNVSPVEPENVLDGVQSLDISTWNYTGNDDIEHLGPMAEQFHDTFGLGSDEKRISNVDADGVALAAIQALSTKLDETRTELHEKNERIDTQTECIEELEAQNEELRVRLTALEDHLGPETEPADD